MYWYKRLYFGDNAIEKSKEIMRSLKKNEPCFGIYLVVISNIQGNLLDILEWPEYVLDGPIRQKARRFRHSDKDDRCIVGVASGYQDALSLVRRIIDEVYRETGGFDIAGYLGVEQDK
ncbi:MAG: hypothetical protein PUB17_01890 [Lachnospiraceae bacterium]|nr:hypothetical protein [Lachnospiraceae bacterium]